MRSVAAICRQAGRLGFREGVSYDTVPETIAYRVDIAPCPDIYGLKLHYKGDMMRPASMQ